MDKSAKLLIFSSLLIIISGFSLLWFGLRQNPSTPVIETPPIATSSAELLGIDGERAFVSKVVDGDTIELQNGQVVRFVGMDTPETVDPRRPVGCFGKEASNETKSLLWGKEVVLQKDVSETDKYGRLLRFVFLPLENGQVLFINDYLVREGFAKAKTYPPDVKYKERFQQAETEAQDNKRGMWKSCSVTKLDEYVTLIENTKYEKIFSSGSTFTGGYSSCDIFI